jgi:hypothetical protein
MAPDAFGTKRTSRVPQSIVVHYNSVPTRMNSSDNSDGKYASLYDFLIDADGLKGTTSHSHGSCRARR